MKPKNYRLHHHRKQLQKNDPLRLCPAYRDGENYTHVPAGTIFAFEDLITARARLTTTCLGCGSRVESTVPLGRLDPGVDPWDVEWRTEVYVIEEEPV
ncbi:MAG TPA: hypothetical protein VFH56_02855 [Acidimicrobiales bacterium]|nr:hypothetical protein [Acidimicrobiales bacterium]